jgi:hypothetical protein
MMRLHVYRLCAAIAAMIAVVVVAGAGDKF